MTTNRSGISWAIGLAWLLSQSTGCTPSEPKGSKSVDQSANPPGQTDPSAALPAQTDESPVLVTVNGKKITEADLGFWLMGGHGQQVTPELREQALDHVIEMELLYQRGLELGLDRDRKYQASIQRQVMRLEVSKRKEMARRVGNREIAARVRVEEAEAKKFYDENAAAIGSEYHLGGLTFPTPQAAEAALKEIEAGKTFEDLAAQRKSPKGAPKPTWDMGFLAYNKMPAEWAAAVATLEPGKVSGIVHGQRTGIRILKLIAKRPNPKADFDAMKAMIMNRLRDQKVVQVRKQYIKDLRAKAKIVLNR